MVAPESEGLTVGNSKLPDLISNPVVFLAMIITGFAIGECGKAKGWW